MVQAEQGGWVRRRYSHHLRRRHSHMVSRPPRRLHPSRLEEPGAQMDLGMAPPPADKRARKPCAYLVTVLTVVICV